MNNITTELNEFFVKCFNDILREEEKALAEIANDKISVKEVHLIEAIYKAEENNDTTLGSVSKLLGISQGTLTVAVNALEKKGYVIRVQNPNDRRSYSLMCTKLGEYVNELHLKFHKDMIVGVVNALTPSECTVLSSALKKLDIFFKTKNYKEKK